MLFIERHAPVSLNHFAGNALAVSRVKQWALGFSLNQIGKPLLLHGPSGCGKSALARALAKQMNWALVVIDPPAPADKEKWERQLASAFSGSSLFGDSSLVLVEDIDSWAAAKARTAITILINRLEAARVPVILTAIDPYERSLSALRSHCELVPMKAVNSADIDTVLARISKAERLTITAESLAAISSNASGDLRAAIGDLQADNPAATREHERSILERVRAHLRAPSLRASRMIQLSNLSERDTLKLYICENLPNEITDARDRADAYRRLSRADVFDGRIRRSQYWGFLRYSSDLMGWGVASCRRHPSAAFVNYSFPSYIQKMGATKSRRALRRSLAEKISPKTHTTTKRAADFIPLLMAQASALSARSAAALSGMALQIQSDAPPSPQASPATPPATSAAYLPLISYYSIDDDELAGLLEMAPSNLGKATSSTRAKKAKSAPKKNSTL